MLTKSTHSRQKPGLLAPVVLACLGAALVALAGVAVADPLLPQSVIEEASKNFVANSGFEIRDAVSIPRWRRGERTNWRAQETVKHSGGYALTASGSEAFSCSVQQTVALKVGQTYTLSAWMKSDGLTTKGTGENTVGVKLIDYGWHWSVALRPDAPTSDWKRYSVTFTAPPSAHTADQAFHVTVFMPRYEQGKLWVDDVQVERGAQATAYTAKAVPDLTAAVTALNSSQKHLTAMPAALEALQPQTPAVEQLRARVKRAQQDVATAAQAVRQFGQVDDATWAAALAVAERVPRQVRQMTWLAWWANPWEYSSRRQAPATVAEPAAQTLQLAVNDYMPLTLSLTNLGSESLDLQVRLVPAERPKGVAAGVFLTPPWATLRQARRVAPTSETGTEYPAILPRLDESQVLSVGPAETAQLWLDIDTSGMAPGDVQVSLQLTPQQDLEPRSIALTLRVLPVRLPEKCPAEVFCWGLNPIQTLGESADMSQEEINRLQDPWLRDLTRHGVNRLLHASQTFTPRFAADDSLAEPIDFTWHDKLLASKRRHVDSFVGGYSVAYYHLPAIPDAQFERRFAAMMKAWIAHLQELGLTPRQFPFEMMDEPSGDKAQVSAVAYKVMKQFAPEWLAMSSISLSAPKDLTDLSKIMEIMVVMPGLTPAADQVLKDSGREIWTYQCLRSLGTVLPYSYYRMQPWVTWAKGYKGFGFYWDMYNQLSPRDNVYSPYVFGSDGPVPSRGWQAFWRGTRDWTYLAVLQERIAAARTAGRNQDADVAQQTLTQAVAAVSAAKDDTALADLWRERILEQLTQLNDLP